MTLRESIKRLPSPLKQGIRYAYGMLPPRVRYGKVFWETYDFLQESQWWSREELEEYQMHQISKLLQHAYENVPYYREVFDERDLKPSDIQELDDLKKIPYLTKDTIRARAKDLLAQNFDPVNLPLSHTSGTTGKPLQFYEDPLTEEKEWAFICHQWSRVGYKPGDLRVELRGPVDRDKPVWYLPAIKVLRLSPLIEGEKKAAYYLEKMQGVGAKFLHGYPGAISSFAFLIKKYRLEVPFSLRAVLFASEAVYPWQQELVQEVFRCRVFSFYGMAEKAVLASGCEQTDYYHCIPQYGITEIDPDTKEIIGTGFLNYATPFIRYKTTDIASMPISLICETCGRSYYPLFARVEGRIEDYIVSPEGAQISPAIITHPFKDLTTIKDTQVVQKDVNLVMIRAVPKEAVDSEAMGRELKQLCQGLQAIIGESVQVKWEIVEEIERSRSGKFKWIISDVSGALGK
jgi:phenylacetate-CoA ligase